MSTYDAIRNAARAFEREFVRSDPAMPAPATLATLAQELTGLIGSLPGAVLEPLGPIAGAQVVPLGHSANQAAQNAARVTMVATAGISVQVRTRSSNASLSRSFNGPA